MEQFKLDDFNWETPDHALFYVRKTGKLISLNATRELEAGLQHLKNNYEQLKEENKALKVALAPFVLFAREVTRINKGDKNEILYESGESSLVLYEFQKAIDTWNNILKNK